MENATEKTCKTCGLSRPHEAFYVSDKYSCKDCKKAYSRSWREKNRERHRKLSLDWAKSNKEHVKARMRDWFEKNRESVNARNRKWRAMNRKKSREYNNLWKRNNYKVKPYLNSALRAAQRRAITPIWANTFFIEEIYDLARRRTNLTGAKWHVDHIVPVNSPIVCGLHVEHNLQVIPANKNMEKLNRHWPDMP